MNGDWELNYMTLSYEAHPIQMLHSYLMLYSQQPRPISQFLYHRSVHMVSVEGSKSNAIPQTERL